MESKLFLFLLFPMGDVTMMMMMKQQHHLLIYHWPLFFSKLDKVTFFGYKNEEIIKINSIYSPINYFYSFHCRYNYYYYFLIELNLVAFERISN